MPTLELLRASWLLCSVDHRAWYVAKKEVPDPELHNELLQIWGYVDRDSKGNYANVPEEFSVIENDEEIEAKHNLMN